MGQPKLPCCSLCILVAFLSVGFSAELTITQLIILYVSHQLVAAGVVVVLRAYSRTL